LIINNLIIIKIGQNGTKPSGSGPGPSGNRPQGGKNVGRDGRPETNIPQNIAYLQGNVTNALASKTGAWATLRNEIVNNLNATSGYKPNGGLMRSILQRVSGTAGQTLSKEFSKFIRSNETCPNDYLYYCKDGVCGCADNNCPAEVSAITTISLAANIQATFQNKASLRYLQSTTPANGTAPSGSGMSSGSGMPSGSGMQISSTDLPSTYYICSVCFGGKRYTFAEASFPTSGNLIDFTDGSGNNLGREAVKQQNNCANALNSGNSDQKAQCRGQINDDCAKKMDNTCGATGLYNMLVKNPVPQSALPAVCDDSLSTYSDSNCFNWLMPQITKATIVFDYRGFLDLPRAIATSFGTSRRLQTSSSIKVVTNDPVQLKDSTAALPATVSQVTNSEVSVDGATVSTAPTANQYLTALTNTVQNVSLNQSFLSYTYSIFVFALFALLF